jgi:hypothetical protein
VLVVLVTWLTLLGWVEDRMDTHFNLFDRWRWDDELMDLVRWVGWTPLAIWVERRIGK